MTRRKLSEYEDASGRGMAVISFNSLEEQFEIDYYDNLGHHFFMEEFPNKTIGQVETIAEDWSMGYRKLEKVA